MVGVAKAPFVAAKTFRRGIKRSNVRRQIRKDKLLTKLNLTEQIGWEEKGFLILVKVKKL